MTTILFQPNHQPLAEGRNGVFKASAIDVTPFGRDEVWLWNWTSKEQLGRGHAVLPQDPVVLRQVARAIIKIAEKIENDN